MLKVYAIELQYEGVQALYATRTAAEKALEDEDAWPTYLPYFIREWDIES